MPDPIYNWVPRLEKSHFCSPVPRVRSNPFRSFTMKKHHIYFCLTLALACISANPTARAGAPVAISAYDGFDYPEGSITNRNGGSGWGTVWYDCGGGANSVISNSLTYSSLNVTGNMLTDIGGGTNCHRRLPDFHGISGATVCEGSTI